MMPRTLLSLLLFAASFAGAAAPYRIEAPQWESILAPVYVDQRWEYFSGILELPGVNGVSLAVMDHDGFPGKNPDILSWKEEDFVSARGVFIWLADHSIVPNIRISSAENNTHPDWRAINGNRWRPLYRDDRLSILNLTLPLIDGIPAIIDLGEEWDDNFDVAVELATIIRLERPDVLISITNPHSGSPRTRSLDAAKQLYNMGLLDFLNYQSGPGDESLPPLPKFYGVEKTIASLQIPVVVHERFDGNRYFDLNDALAWATITNSIGMSIYPGYQDRCNDLFCVNVLDWKPFYNEFELTRKEAAITKTLGLISGTTPLWVDVNGDGIIDSSDF